MYISLTFTIFLFRSFLHSVEHFYIKPLWPSELTTHLKQSRSSMHSKETPLTVNQSTSSTPEINLEHRKPCYNCNRSTPQNRQTQKPKGVRNHPLTISQCGFSWTTSRIHVIIDPVRHAPEAIHGRTIRITPRAGHQSLYFASSLFFFVLLDPSRQIRAKTRPFLVVNRATRPHRDRAIALLMSPPWEISKISPQRNIWRGVGGGLCTRIKHKGCRGGEGWCKRRLGCTVVHTTTYRRTLVKHMDLLQYGILGHISVPID